MDIHCNLRWMLPVTSHQLEVNIGSGSGIVPSGNKQLPERMLTLIYVAIWHH